MEETNQAQPYLYLNQYGQNGILFFDNVLAGLKDRYRYRLEIKNANTIASCMDKIKNKQVKGVVLRVMSGMPARSELKLASFSIDNSLPVWFYYENEHGIEYISKEKVESYWRHWAFIKLFQEYGKTKNKIQRSFRYSKRFLRRLRIALSLRAGRTSRDLLKGHELAVNSPQNVPLSLKNAYRELEQFLSTTQAVPLAISDVGGADEDAPLFKQGAYLRLDYWGKIKAGGSYGHTCHVARALSHCCEQFLAMMTNHYELLDQMGVKQVTLDDFGESFDEKLILANDFYYDRIKYAMKVVDPAFIYERICLGNYVGAKLSRDLNIPYIVEYNGSEIVMKRSYDSAPYLYEDFYLNAEIAAFQQATLISVISKTVYEDLVARGIPSNKILINPNCADPESYKPLPYANKNTQRQAMLNWSENECVVGFIGTFGGWHGIDILVKAVPEVLRRCERVRFLLIGDGNCMPQVRSMVEAHGIADKVHLPGIVEQAKAIDYLQLCDVFISPHSGHMVTTKFFGSPTKIFEYMALGQGIVASDLMQIGDVLRPALYAKKLKGGFPEITQQRAILCSPGDINQLIDAICLLAENPAAAKKLGENARQAILSTFNWQNHIKRLWQAIKGEELPCLFEEDIPEPVASPKDKMAKNMSDYKKETQKQWDNDPCGSHYVKNASQHSLDWYMEAESYRYGIYGPWMQKDMGFTQWAGKKVLEIGSGMGTDLCQFAANGAEVYDLDLSMGHINYARENMALRGLKGNFCHADAELIPFADNSFDCVYSNGVIHHSPNTQKIVNEIFRILKPGGTVKIMVYAENSLHYWRNLVHDEWWVSESRGQYGTTDTSIAEVMSKTVEISEEGAKPLVKVYTKKRLTTLFDDFENIKIIKRQMLACELPKALRFLPVSLIARWMGWNLILTASKPKAH